MQALQKAQENCEQAQQEVIQAQTDLEMLMQEALLPVVPVPQINVSLVKTLEALKGIIENLWNPDAGQPPENLIHAIQESRQILQNSSVTLSGGWRNLGCRVGSRTGSREGAKSIRWRTSKRQSQGHAKLQWGIHRQHHRRRRRAPRRQRLWSGWCPVLAGPKAVSSSNAESQRHGTSGVVATCMCDHPSSGKFLKLCIASPYTVAWVCSSTHPGRHRPACFDQTCGNSGEGPLTTVDSPDVPEPSLTPTQELRTCDMVRRKTTEKRGGHEVCRACGTQAPALTERSQMEEMSCMGLQRSVWKGCCGFTFL